MKNDDVSKASDKSLYHIIIELLHRFLYDLKHSFWLLLACIVLVVGMLFLYNKKQSSIYKSSFTVAYDDLIRKVYGDRLDKLNSLVERGQHDKVSTLLNVDRKTSATIKGIEGVNIIGEDLVDDMNTDTIPFVVHLYMVDTFGLNSVQNGIVSYLETGNSYLEDLKTYRKKQIAEEIAFVDRQLSLLDSAKASLLQKNARQLDAESLESIYNLSYDLYKKKQHLLQRQAIPSTLHVIDEAIIPLPKGRSYLLLAILGIVVGGVVYFIIRYLLIPAIRYKG